ncbi:queuosine precursor transporter [Corynebacterium mendelii]|uniref:Probable queuosine precursor transporter n=1 Tax=Corynebacterium mendelii TaxID=2765362 RepID=A0A939DZK6_9CORY|nr:queuosine precursor transporter [Corynebacterium mendelii]MBN9643724.1 queuosine precursor transporter [Corynebacterium mendelii]
MSDTTSGQGVPVETGASGKARFIPVQKTYYPVIVALFVAVFLISNITATKGVAIGPVITDGAFFLFPVAYVLGDVLSECYGFKATRTAVWTGFAAMLLMTVAFYAAIALPAADFYDGQDSFAAVLGLVPRIVLASLAGYLVGQLLNSWSLVAIKKRTGEKTLWARLLGSTVVGEFGDTLVFCLIAAPVIGITTIGDTVNYTVAGFFWKTLVEVAVMPLTYLVIRYVKNKENYTG